MILVELTDAATFYLVDHFVGNSLIQGFETTTYVDIDLIQLSGETNLFQVLLRGVIGGGAGNSVAFDVRKQQD